MTNPLASLWDRLVSAITGEATTVEETLSELEQKLLPAFSALCAKIEATIGAQGVTVLEQGLGDIATAMATGGNLATVIPTIVSEVTADVKADAKQDANTAAHGALELLISTLPASTPAVSAATGAPPVAANDAAPAPGTSA